MSQCILIVDDEPLNRDYLEQELVDRGYDVDTAADGPEALQKVAEVPPDLVLLDVVMPTVDGIEVCRRLKDDPDTRLIPIIIMTALAAREDRIRGVEAGADDFLTKPVDEDELHARISGALRLKQAIDRKLVELESASARIAQLGQHDEDVAVVAAMVDAEGASRLVAALEGAGGLGATVAGAPVAAVFRGSQPSVRARAAANAAREATATGAALGLAVGSALVGSERTTVGDEQRWVLTAEGPAVDRALQAATAAQPGQVLVGERELDQVGTAYPASPAGVDGLPLFDLAGRDVTRTPQAFQLAFPQEYAALETEMTRAWQVESLYLTRALSGLSGARVYAVDIECADHSGQAILKLEALSDPEWDEEDEADRHRRALTTCPTFADAHLPRLLHVLRDEDSAATLSTVVAGGLEYCLAWFRAPYERQLQAGPRVMRDILESWNAGYTLAPGLLAPAALLERWLRYRLDPGEGRIYPFLDGLGIDPLVPTFLLEGHWYPNPLAFARTAPGVAVAPPLRAAVGQTHGDLHGYNVLTSQSETDVPDYFLIDMAFYEDDSFLLFDQAYFELAYLLRTRENVSVSRWGEVLAGLLRGTAVAADDVGVVRLVEAVRQATHDWIREHEANRISYMSSQMLLGRIGAGLNYASKNLSTDLRLKSLLYAATALKQYVKMHELDWPRWGQVVQAPQARE